MYLAKPKILFDRNIWRDICRLSDTQITLKAFRWGEMIILSWRVIYVGKLPNADLHFDKVAYSKPILSAWKESKIDLVATVVSESEIAHREKIIRNELEYHPTVLGEQLDMYKYLLERDLLPEGIMLSDYYPPHGKHKKQIRQIFIEHYDDRDWQKFRKKVKLQKADYSDGFIFWQATLLGVDFIVTADLKFINKSKTWSKALKSNLLVCTAEDVCVRLDLGERENLWTTELRNVLHQRSINAGYISNARGKLWLLKKILKRDLGYVAPKEAEQAANVDQIVKALINHFLRKEYFQANDFNVK